MNVFLLYKSHDFDSGQPLPWNDQELTQDLELDVLFKAMSLEDDFLFKVVKAAILTGLNNDLETITYRQDILKDCLRNADVARSIYAIAVEAIESRKTHWFSIFSRYPSSILMSSVGMLQIFVEILKRLRGIADEHAGKFESKGFTRFFTMLKEELTDEYFGEVQNHLEELKFDDGILISAELGKGNKGIGYMLRKLQDKRRTWMQQLFGPRPEGYTFTIPARDESGARALSEIKDEGINRVANAAAQSADHILGFFNMLRTEMAFYIGALNVHEQLTQLGGESTFPITAASPERKHSFKGLFDVSLALSMKQKVIGNDLEADGKGLVIITGANQGGKSTFLRSIGMSQLMMQCGLFVPAEVFCANVCRSLFTHFKREEDNAMESGKLDEELGRMSGIIDHMTPDAMGLFNESFAATNEREGSEIARQLVNALLEKGIKLFFVTHLYPFAHDFYDRKQDTALFLRAERETDARRTFKLIVGEPLETSYGADLYNKIFVNG